MKALSLKAKKQRSFLKIKMYNSYSVIQVIKILLWNLDDKKSESHSVMLKKDHSLKLAIFNTRYIILSTE